MTTNSEIFKKYYNLALGWRSDFWDMYRKKILNGDPQELERIARFEKHPPVVAFGFPDDQHVATWATVGINPSEQEVPNHIQEDNDIEVQYSVQTKYFAENPYPWFTKPHRGATSFLKYINDSSKLNLSYYDKLNSTKCIHLDLFPFISNGGGEIWTTLKAQREDVIKFFLLPLLKELNISNIIALGTDPHNLFMKYFFNNGTRTYEKHVINNYWGFSSGPSASYSEKNKPIEVKYVWPKERSP